MYLIQSVLSLLLLCRESALVQYQCHRFSQSHHFTTALIELFDRLIKLLYRERHVEGVSGSSRLTIEMIPKSTKLSPHHFLWTSGRRYRGVGGVCGQSSGRSWWG